MTAQDPARPVLVAADLSKTFPVRRSLKEIITRAEMRALTAVDQVSLEVSRGETLGIVGESGSGKSTLAHCLVRLIDPDEGTVRLGDVDLLTLKQRELREVRRRIQIVFQDPYSSLNPRLAVGNAITEPARVHGMLTRKEETAFAAEMLDRVGLSERLADRRPRELSGGQRQRVAIARALALSPEVLIADEAVSALDVSIQAQILNLLADLRDELGIAMIFISHQLPIVSHIAERVAVMYLGRIVEEGPTERIFGDPRHPYTAGLLKAIPRVGVERRRRQPAIRGELPSAIERPSGCSFRTRCPLAISVCTEVEPPAVEVAPGHLSRCHVLAPAAGVSPAANGPTPTKSPRAGRGGAPVS